jgi:hypothetical protein
VKNGWQAEQISTFISFITEPNSTLLPQAQVASIVWYSGWIPFFIAPIPPTPQKVYNFYK